MHTAAAVAAGTKITNTDQNGKTHQYPGIKKYEQRVSADLNSPTETEV